MSQTLFDKLWQQHLVTTNDVGDALIYIDLQLLHEVTSPQAFEGLRLAGRQLWQRGANLATTDHSIPTTPSEDTPEKIKDAIARLQVVTLDSNCSDFDVLEFGMGSKHQGIVHMVGPELGATLPGMTIVCGDSHTSTNGAFACFAFGIGTSEVEHVMSTQCLWMKKPKNMRAVFSGQLPAGVYAKDMILALIRQIGTAGATGYALEYSGDSIARLSMEERMTICNMSVEAGARAGLMAVDQTTIDYVRDRPYAPQGADFDSACKHWQQLVSDPGSRFDQEVAVDVSKLEPQLSWGTSPEMVVGISEAVPQLSQARDASQQRAWSQALDYMGLKSGQLMQGIKLDKVFIGSCTNARIEDLRVAAGVVKNKKVASTIKQALVVPGSQPVKTQAEQEGLDKVFLEAGFEWRNPGCSMCLGMNPDQLGAGERCASTSNRNFEGRQGYRGRTHLLSPAMAAAAAISGRFVDTRELD